MTGFIRKSGCTWIFPVQLLMYWMLFFTVFRVWFLLWFRKEWTEASPWVALWKALPLDLSMAGYLIALPVLAWFAGMSAGKRVQGYIVKGIVGFHLLIFTIILFAFTANIFLYEEWHTPINNRAIEYVRTPESLLNSMSFIFKVVGTIAYFVLYGLNWLLYKRVVGTQIFPEDKLPFWHLGWMPVQVVLIFLAIRGGLGVMPINESAVYYSTNSLYNHAATNTAWHLVHSVLEARTPKNHYKYMTDVAANAQKAQLLHVPQLRTPHSWLQLNAGQRPNIVFILMESMTAQVIAELGGQAGVCPNMGKLADQGILFTRCYSSGYRTEQGLIAVLGGFPAQPDQSIILQPEKAAKLSSVPKMLKGEGYTNVFLYGGELTFANIGVWLHNQQFEHIIAQPDFPEQEVTQRWGADDRHVFDRAIATFRGLPQPFFANILTLSLHTPFDVPYESQWLGETEAEKFLHSAAFVDMAVGEFFEKARQEPWYDNTLFVLMADHGHHLPGGIRMDEPRSRHIPLIFTGPLIHPDWRGRRVATIGNHHDVPATILDELGFSATPFTWSKDLLAEQTPQFAYYSNENGLGWITPEGAGFYRFARREWKWYSGTLDSASTQTALGYLQTLYNDFLAM